MGKNPAEKLATKAKSPVKAARTAVAKRTKAKKPKISACRVQSCKREYRAKGYCVFHYKKWRQGTFGVARYKHCTDKGGCSKPMALNRHGLCETHYQTTYVSSIGPKPEAEPKKVEKVA